MGWIMIFWWRYVYVCDTSFRKFWGSLFLLWRFSHRRFHALVIRFSAIHPSKDVFMNIYIYKYIIYEYFICIYELISLLSRMVWITWDTIHPPGPTLTFNSLRLGQSLGVRVNLPAPPPTSSPILAPALTGDQVMHTVHAQIGQFLKSSV